MKKVILFALVSIFLMSCGGAGKNPDDYITLGQAFTHVSNSFSYWLFISIAVASNVGYCVYQFKGWSGYNKSLSSSLPVIGVLLAALAFAILFRPCEVAANTTVEQMLRGVYIGY